jgi:hypothetical protein
VLSSIDSCGGKAERGGICNEEEGIFGVRSVSKSTELQPEEECDIDMRSCIKYGIVEMRGERAQGFVGDVRSCSKVGSTNLTKRYSHDKPF